jgi:LemA protein
MNVSHAEPITGPHRRIGPVLVTLIVILAICGLGAGWFAGQYNRLVQLDQAVQGQWAQVENAYQRRADLVPALVATVKGAASFEKDTLTAVTQARAGLQSAPKGTAPNPGQLEAFQKSQDNLGTALGRLMVVVEAYPELHATSAFRDLQAQLEGTENRIAAERMRFNQATQQFNIARNSFPTGLVASMFGSRFAEKAFFQARPESQLPPKVQF